MNINEVKSLIDNSDVICFDIFDTLVSRSCYPDYTKKAWSIYVKDVFGLENSVHDILSKRKELEYVLCEKNNTKHGEKEFQYNELLKEMYKYLQIKISFKQFSSKCIELETDIEKKVQHVKPDVVEILKYCKKKNKNIICISDMYLSKDMLYDIFKYHNIDKYFNEIYVSNEIFKTKRNGTIYSYVADKLKVSTDKMLMIGDNYHSDYENAKNAGCSSFWINNSNVENFYKRNLENDNEDSILKKFALNYQDKKETFVQEYKLYQFIYKLGMYIYAKNISNITVEAEQEIKEQIEERISFLKNESWLLFKNNSKTNVTVKVSNDELKLYDGKKEVFSEEIKLNLLNIKTFEQIVDMLLNKDYSLDKVNDILTSRIDREETNQLLSEGKKESLINVGKSYSYLFYRFAKWMAKDCEEKGIKKIYFFTREGEFYKEIFDVIKPASIKSELLEVSRVATFCSSLRNVSIDELKRIWSLYSSQSMKALCKSLDIPLQKIESLLSKYHICACEEILYPFLDERVKALFEDKLFKQIVESCISEKRDLITKYFASKGLVDKKQNIAIVDIGWRGTIQDNVCYILPNTTIYGYYFALYDFLNEQPANAFKYGFLNQFKGGPKYLWNITPFEMLCNSPNGSTTGYSLEGGIHAVRKIDEYENRSYDNCIKYVQAGIIEDIKENKDNFDDEDNKRIFDVLTNIIYQPNYDVAKAYFNLKHNEEFGLGDYVYKKKSFHYSWLFLGAFSKKYRTKFRDSLISSTWTQGFLKVNKMGILNQHYKKKSLCKGDEDYVSTKKKIAWIIPYPIKGSGGHRTIVQNANALVREGYECDLYVDEDFISTSEGMKKKIATYFDECLCDVYVGAKLRKKYDLVFATHAILTTDYTAACECENKGYFIQDFEPWFMPMGDLYLSMERSYKYNFKGASIGRWLANKIKTEYGSEVKYFNFCADLNVYKPLNNIEKENAICFIFQPEKPRRCHELGLKALKLVKELRPDIKVYLYGSKTEYNPGFECENLHIMPISECNKLYNKCKAGLCISASNPSRIPFEMMAAGLPVVDLYRENNLYDMPDNGVLLADSTPEAIATALIKIIDDEKFAKEMSKNGKAFMKNYPLEKGYEQFLEIVASMFDNEYKNTESIEKIYKKGPVLPSDEVMKVSYIIQPKPMYKETGPFVRKIVRIKKGVIRRVRRLIGR